MKRLMFAIKAKNIGICFIDKVSGRPVYEFEYNGERRLANSRVESILFSVEL